VPLHAVAALSLQGFLRHWIPLQRACPPDAVRAAPDRSALSGGDAGVPAVDRILRWRAARLRGAVQKSRSPAPALLVPAPLPPAPLEQLAPSPPAASKELVL